VVACDTPQTHMSIVRALSAEPEGPMSTVPRTGPSDILFSFAELRTFPTSCSLNNGRIGFVAMLLLVVLAHRLGMRRFPPVRKQLLGLGRPSEHVRYDTL